MREYLVATLVLLAGAAHAQFKCVSPSGAVAFQQAPCAPGSTTASRPPAAPEPVREWSAAAVRVGMTTPEVYKSAGRVADRESTTQTAGGTSRQMVFEDRHARVYVYTLDDVVTAVQSVPVRR